MDRHIIPYRNILRLHNHETDTLTCPGFANSRERQCSIQIPAAGQTEVEHIVRQLAEAPTTGDAADDYARDNELLNNIANIVLCRHHRDQAEGLRFRWSIAVMHQRWSDVLQARIAAERAAARQAAELPMPPAAPAQSRTRTEGGRSDCAICLEPPTEPVLTPCGHKYCLECVAQLFHGAGGQKKCPLCRRMLAWTELVMVES